MRVLQINSFFTMGGPPKIMNGIYDTLKENGHECKIAAAREEMYVPQDSYRIESDLQVKINALKARLFDSEGFNAKSATRHLIQYIRSYDPDIIHLHNLHGYYINLPILFNFLKEYGKPVVWTLHDCWAFTGHCAHFSDVRCEKWKSECIHCPQIREYPASFFVDASRKNCKLKKSAYEGINQMTIVTPSNWLASFIGDSVLSKHPVKAIYNGIDTHAFRPVVSDVAERMNFANKEIVLGVAQNWAEKKGFEDFISLANQLDEKYQVVMIGLTEELITKLPSSIIGLQRTRNQHELIEWYSAASVFVNMTYQDTFPTVNLQALACGTPIITYRTGGSPEAIDQSCGWVVEQGKIQEVKRIIESIANKSDYSDACRKRSLLFDRKERYQEYISLYQELLEG